MYYMTQVNSQSNTEWRPVRRFLEKRRLWLSPPQDCPPCCCSGWPKPSPTGEPEDSGFDALRDEVVRLELELLEVISEDAAVFVLVVEAEAVADATSASRAAPVLFLLLPLFPKSALTGVAPG